MATVDHDDYVETKCDAGHGLREGGCSDCYCILLSSAQHAITHAWLSCSTTAEQLRHASTVERRARRPRRLTGTSKSELQRCPVTGECTGAQQLRLKYCSNGGCGPWHRSTGWVSRAREAAHPPGWVCKAHLPSAQRRGALQDRVRAHMPSRRFRARSSIVVPVLCLSFLSCRFLFYSFLLSS